MSKYPLNKDFRMFANFRPPINKAVIAGASVFFALSPKGLRSNKQLLISKYKLADSSGAPVTAYMISPKTEEVLPCLVYCHGGGFVFKAANYHYQLAKEYAKKAGCKVLFVDYRLAPKYKYPTPSDDCFMYYEWVVANAETLGIAADKIAVGGDSAGGCLAADIVFRAKERGISLPCFQMLICPVLDKRMITDSMTEFSDTPMWNAKSNHKMWQYYLDGQQYVSPMEAEDISFFAHTYIETAEFDCLRDEGGLFAEKLRSQGVEVTAIQTEGTMHGFDFVLKSETTQKCVEARINALKTAFAGSK